MQSDDDWHTVRVADHAIDPAPMPGAGDAPEAASVAAGSVSAGSASGASGASDASGTARSRRRRRGRHGRRRDASGARDLLIWCGVPVLIVLLLRVFLVGFYSIPSGSMRDTIEPGDRVVTSKLSPSVFPLKRGDVVVFKDPANWLSSEQGTNGTEYLIKRLIGLPGDVVECDGAGQPIKVNGVAIDESSYLRPGVDPSAFPFRVEVTAGRIFVLGDNRASSADSRWHQDDGEHGLVPISDVVGVGMLRYWPLNRIGILDGHHEVFDQVPDGTSSN